MTNRFSLPRLFEVRVQLKVTLPRLFEVGVQNVTLPRLSEVGVPLKSYLTEALGRRGPEGGRREASVPRGGSRGPRKGVWPSQGGLGGTED